MKLLALATAAVLTTVSLSAKAADQPAKQQKDTSPAPAAATSTATPAPAAPLQTVTQPPPNSLAAVAQQTNAARGAKKAKISITNDNLVRAGGHITTANSEPAALPATPPAGIGKTTEQMVAEANAERKAVIAKQQKKAAEDRQKRIERAGNALDDTALDANDDPALVEHRMAAAEQGTQGTTQPAPQTTQTVPTVETIPTTTQKPPL
jgi:hypothetical protein